MKALVLNDLDQEAYVVTKPEPMDSLEFMQSLVDGLICHVDGSKFGKGCDVWVNDEGLFRDDFDLNQLASELTQQPLVGPAVVLRCNSQGDTLSITELDLDRWDMSDHPVYTLEAFLLLRQTMLGSSDDNS